VFTWSQFISLVLSILTDAQPSDETFTIAVAEYVKAKTAREYDRDVARHDSYWRGYLQQRDRLVGYQYSNPGLAAQNSITWAAQPNNNDTLTVGTKVYTFVNALTNIDGQILIGPIAQASVINAAAAINRAAGAGILYSSGMSPNLAGVTASASNLTLTVSASIPGVAGNSIAVASSGVAQWLQATLVGGSDSPLFAAVNNLISVDSNRQGATSFIQEMIRQAQLDISNRSRQIVEYIRLGVIDLQTAVPMYRVGQSKIYTIDDFTLVGCASQANMSEGAQITDAYYQQLTSSVTAVNIVNEGEGYTVANVNFSGDGQNAAGEAIISHGKIIGVQMTMFGYGYTECTVTITGDGTGATAVAVLNA